MKRHRDIVGRAHLLRADALLFDQPCQRRGAETQDSGAGSANFAAVAGSAFRLADGALQAQECTGVVAGPPPCGLADSGKRGPSGLKPAVVAPGSDRSICHR